MDELLRKIYDLYFDEENSNKVFDDLIYKKAMDKLCILGEATKSLATSESKDQLSEIIDQIFIENMSISNLYRYYDYTEGLLTGIALGMLSYHFHNPDIVIKINKYLDDTYNRKLGDNKNE